MVACGMCESGHEGVLSRGVQHFQRCFLSAAQPRRAVQRQYGGDSHSTPPKTRVLYTPEDHQASVLD